MADTFSNSSSDEDDWDEYESEQDSEDYAVPIVDFFTSHIHQGPKEFKQSMKQDHQFNIDDVFQELQLDTYNRIRLINYMRSIASNHSNMQGILSDVRQNKSTWINSDDYLTPVIENDGLLQYAVALYHGFDSDDEWSNDEEYNNIDDDEDLQNRRQRNTTTAESLTQDQDKIRKQHQEITFLHRRVDELQDLLEVATDKLKTLTLQEVVAPTTTSTTSSTSSSNNDPSTDTSIPSSTINMADLSLVEKPDLVKEADVPYFESYSDRLIHEIMLRDAIRTEAYRDAIELITPLIKDKIVLDVGCGSGILSLFAARCGAKMVLSVDAASLIEKTRVIIEQNGYKDIIHPIRGKVEEVVLPVDSVDIIISEWMGYYLVYESMLPSVLYARNKWMRREDSGISIYEENKQHNAQYEYNDQTDAAPQRLFASHTRMLPDVARMYVAASNCKDFQYQNQNFWKNVYGFDMSVLIHAKDAFPTGDVDIVPSADIVSPTEHMVTFDLMQTQSNDLTFTSHVKLTPHQAGLVDSLTVWFDTTFEGPTTPIHSRTTPIPSTGTAHADTVVLSTSPHHPPTHWKQTLLRFAYIIDAKDGDTIDVTIVSTPRKDNHRHYDIHVTYIHNTSHPTAADTTTQRQSPLMNTQIAEPGQTYMQTFSIQ